MQLYSSKPLYRCRWLCLVWSAGWIELFHSPVLSTYSFYSWRYMCFASQKSGRCLIGHCFPSLLNKKGPVLLPSSPFFRCRFIGMVFQCKCVALSDLFFCPSMFRQNGAIFCILIPPFKNSLAMTMLCIFGFSQHITCFVMHCFDAMIDHAVSLCLCSSLSQSWDFLESIIGRSFRLCWEFGTSVTRGSLGDWCYLQYNSSPIWVIACDRVW